MELYPVENSFVRPGVSLAGQDFKSEAAWLLETCAASESLSGFVGKSQTGPRKTLINMLQGYIQPQLIYVAAKLGLADLLQASPKTYDLLAAELDVAPQALRRVLNGLVGIGILSRMPGCPEVFALTSLGECLVSDRSGSLREVAIFQGEELYAAWGQLLHSVRTGQPAFQKALGSEFFEYLGDNPQADYRFHSFMTNTGNQAVQAFLKAYDFSGIETVVDIGGGAGGLLAGVLERYSNLQGQLFDIAEWEGKERPGQAQLWQRCMTLKGDFFEAVPPVGDNTAVILSQVLHDWDEEKAACILKNCRKAVGASLNVRLLLFENLLLEEGRSPASLVEQDLVMLVLTGGRERTVTEFEKLLEVSGWQLKQVIPTTHSRSILEAWPIS